MIARIKKDASWHQDGLKVEVMNGDVSREASEPQVEYRMKIKLKVAKKARRFIDIGCIAPVIRRPTSP